MKRREFESSIHLKTPIWEWNKTRLRFDEFTGSKEVKVIIYYNNAPFGSSDDSSRVEFELPMLEVGVRVPVVAKGDER